MNADLYLFRAAFKDLTRPRRLLVCLLMITIPVTLAIVLRVYIKKVDYESATAYTMLVTGVLFNFILVLLCVVFGTNTIMQEVEQKTIVYLLTRPVPRWRIALMKYLAAVLVTTLTGWIAILLTALITYGPGDMANSQIGRDMLILPVGALAYTGLFLLFATGLPKPLIPALLFAFGWESWAPNAPGSFQKFSIMSYLRTLAPHLLTGNAANANATFNPEEITSGRAWIVLIGVIAVTVGGALYIFSTKEYVPKEETT